MQSTLSSPLAWQTWRKQVWLLLLGLIGLGLFYRLPTVYSRRVVVFLLVLGISVPHFKKIPSFFRRLPYYGKVTLVFFLVSLSIKFLPGGYFPPFFSGIGGWTAKIDTTQPLKVTGLQLVRDDGKTVWLSNGILSPQNFINRPVALAQKKPKQVIPMLSYYFTLYKRHFPLLAQGRYPNQKYLGQFAYPGHNPYRMMNYKDFPPHRIVEIRRVTDAFDRKSLHFQNEVIIYRYDVASQKMIR